MRKCSSTVDSDGQRPKSLKDHHPLFCAWFPGDKQDAREVRVDDGTDEKQ